MCGGGAASSGTGNDAGGGGTVTATDNGSPVCPLGYTQGITAVGNGTNVTVQALCTGAGFTLVFSPTPAPGGTAPCTEGYPGSSASLENSSSESTWQQGAISGSVTIEGTTGNLTVSGSCTTSGDFYSMDYSGGSEGSSDPSEIVAAFSNLPLTVQ